MIASVTVRRGSVYLTREVYDRYLGGLETCILLRRDDDLLILPVRNAAAGGYLMKLRNSAGDRVVNAADFFREQGIGDDSELVLAVESSEDRGGLEASSAFTCKDSLQPAK